MDIKALTGVDGARPMRIALFSGNYNYTLDGANKSLNRLVAHLQDTAGATVRVYSPTSATPAFRAVGDLVSVPSVKIPFRADYRLALGLPEAIRRDVEAFRPDLIHLSAPDPLGRAAVKLGRNLKVPVVASLHTLFDTYLDYYGVGFLRPVVRRQLWGFYGACDYVLAPTDVIADELRKKTRSTEVRIWSRGVDPQLFNPGRRNEAWRRRSGFDPDRPVIVFLGRIVMEKGLAAFADTVARLEQAGHAPQVLVIGDGPARAWFEARLPRAAFAGFLTGEALAEALASSDIFFNPSTTETFGNVNLEAMACGLAMVCADAPNTRALLRHGRNALLCAPEHPVSYVEALATLLVDEETRRRLAAEALERSAAFRWSEILDEVTEVYAEALNRHAALPAPIAPLLDARLLRPERSGRVEPQPAGLPVL
jgi:phosphatidylinositol alpha 1,6-mannosyltransferase